MLNNNEIQKILGELAEHFDRNNQQSVKETGKGIEYTVDKFKKQVDGMINVCLRRDN